MNTQQAYETQRAYFSRVDAVLAKDGDDKATDASFSARCKYRTAEGAKCAVGVLIPDSMYDAGMDASGGVVGLCDEYPIVKGLLWDVDEKWLTASQHLHDTVAQDAPAFVTLLDLLASASGLNVSSDAHWTIPR